MRQYIITILFLFFCLNLFAQKTKRRHSRHSIWDTTFIIVPLRNEHYDKTLIIEVGENVKIYLSGDSIIKESAKIFSTGFDSDNHKRIKYFLDSAFYRGDTASVNFFELLSIDYLVSQQLQNGSAKVFYNRKKSFVDSISHRLEKYGGEGARFFYLPDKRAFFGVIEIRGILDYRAKQPENHYQDYIKEAEKLKSMMEE